VSRDVVSGAVVAPACGPTRTEADFLAHVEGVVASDAAATRWHFVVDHLDIHRSASLVRWVAAASGRGDQDLGEKGKRGILGHAVQVDLPGQGPHPLIYGGTSAKLY